jgi:hypothetical protein
MNILLLAFGKPLLALAAAATLLAPSSPAIEPAMRLAPQEADDAAGAFEFKIERAPAIEEEARSAPALKKEPAAEQGTNP